MNKQVNRLEKVENEFEMMMMKIFSLIQVDHLSFFLQRTSLRLSSDLIYYNRCQTKQEYPQIIYIHGLGTTSIVHALAEEHHFKVKTNHEKRNYHDMFFFVYRLQKSMVRNVELVRH